MRNGLFVGLLACSLAGCAQAQPADANPGGSTDAPTRFSEYGSRSTASAGLVCVVGATTDPDGLNQRPLAILFDKARQRSLWKKRLAVPSGFYQARATHCLFVDGAMYVLVQSDTRSEQTLSQTQLTVDRLRVDTGGQQSSTDIQVPGVGGAYSAWVPEGAGNFEGDHRRIRVSGRYYALTSPDEPQAFELSLPVQ